MEIIDKYNEYAFTAFKHTRFAITYLEKEWVVLIKAMGVGGKSTYCVGKVQVNLVWDVVYGPTSCG